MMIHTFLLIFLAEMADKTQLMIMALTNKYSLRSVLSGMVIGVFLISGASVLAGDLIGDLIPMWAVELCAAIMFLCFGLSNLRPTKEEGGKALSFHFPILSIAFTFILAELGDKTQLATVAMAADHMGAHIPIFFGASLGLIMANLFGIFAGKLIFKHFSEDCVKVVSSFIFFLFGSINLFELIPANLFMISIYSSILMIVAYICFQRSRRHVRT